MELFCEHANGLVRGCTASLLIVEGNTIFLGLGASHQPPNKKYGWLRSLVAIASFIVGSVAFSHATRRAGNRRRITLALSFGVQAVGIIVAAIFVHSGFSGDQQAFYRDLAPLAFLGFQSGGQVCTSDALGYREIPTTVLTSVYYGLAADIRFFDGPVQNAKRNRRLTAVVLFVAGAIIGGYVVKRTGTTANSLWLCSGIKLAIAATWLFWHADLEEEVNMDKESLHRITHSMSRGAPQ